MPYEPRSIDPIDVELPPELVELTEYLAEMAHNAWAASRLADGWTYGPVRDDRAKKHPDLVPYSELGETEKQLDRNTAMGTLIAIIALGYRITKE